MAASPNYIAGGNIQPSTIVTQAGQTDEAVIQASSASVSCTGIAQEGLFNAPGVTGADSFAAHSGENIRVFGPGEVALCVSATTITTNKLIKPDSIGFGTPVLTSDSLGVYYVGRALEGTTGPNILFRVLVLPGFTTLP